VVKVVILAGGVGSRLSEETDTKPKPMVEVGEYPIIWHIMQSYAAHGFKDFVLCLGYKGEVIKRYFSDLFHLTSDITFDFNDGAVNSHRAPLMDWKVTLVDTGLHTETAGRLLRVREHLGDETFMLTYGDGVADVDITKLVDFHQRHGRLATVTAVHPIARFGHIELDGDAVAEFIEKPQMGEGWINGGFFVLEPGVFDHVPGDVDWAREPLQSLARAGELHAYRHDSFWQCMDTLRDKIYLNQLWESGKAPWRVWS
jgi:glucose-1-phosphate cytidylyltransferase